MKVDAEWFNRQLDHAAAEFDKWPTWMKEAAQRDEEERRRERNEEFLPPSEQEGDEAMVG